MKKKKEQITFARELRQRQTDAERALWTRLRNKQLEGVKFRRQQRIGPYIVDFTSFGRKLIVEVDGGQHNDPSPHPLPQGEREQGDGRVRRDEERTRWLNGKGYRVLRFWNNEVLLNMEGVLERIREALR